MKRCSTKGRVLRWLNRGAFTVLLYALSLFATAGLGRAEQRELKTDQTENIDAVLLLDASGSMRLTDPGRLRDEGAKLFVEFLKPGDRLAIVEFSENAKVLQPLTQFSRAGVEQISQTIAAVTESGLYTDLLAGVREASRILEADHREDARPIIIMLSDGKMDPDPKTGTVASHEKEMLDSVLPDLKSKGIRIHTLSFSDQADKTFLSQVALATDGVNWFTPTADKIHESYAELFLVVKKPQIVPLVGRGFKIDDEIEEATFYINKEDASGLISVINPSGEVLTAQTVRDDFRWYSGSNFEVVTIEKPETGRWEVTGLASNDSFATVLTNLRLITDWPGTFNAHEEVLLQARLYEEKKPINLPQMTGVVRYAYQITPTDRVAEPVVRDFLFDDGTHGDKIADDGIYASSITILEPGEYKLKIVASGPTFQRTQQIPFRVKPRLIDLRVGEGTEGELVVAAPAAHEGEQKEGGGSSGGKSLAGRRFEVVLSDEAAAWKQVELKLVAIDHEDRRFNLPLVRSSMKGGALYVASTSLLPAVGEWQLQATLSGIDTKKERSRAVSDLLDFTLEAGHAVEERPEVQVVPVKDEGPPSPLLGILLLTVINALGSGAAIAGMRKKLSVASVPMPVLPALDRLHDALADIKRRLAVSEVDLSNPDLIDHAALESGAAESSFDSAESGQSPDSGNGTGDEEEM